MLNIIVLARQVKLETNSAAGKPEISETEIKCDFTAVEAAVRLKEILYCRITALILGYEKTAVRQARDAVAMGCDSARVICAEQLEELDSWSCASVFARSLSGERYDLLMSGGFPVDADTVPIGLLTASMLKLPVVTSVDRITAADENFAVIERKEGDMVQRLKVNLPCFASVLPHPEAPVYKTVPGINKAYSIEIGQERLDPAWNENKAVVSDSLKTEARKRGTILTAVSTEEAVSAMAEKITAAHLM